MDKPRLAMIGCGPVSDFHATAFQHAGFELAAVCARPSSERLHPFAERYEIPVVCDDVDSLLETRSEWDAILIATPTEATLPVLEQAIEVGVPILVEKPVASHSEELKPFLDPELPPVLVGYNRRFYRPVMEARRQVEESPLMMAQLSIPEAIRTPETQDENPDYHMLFFQNSVHGLDLAQYVFGRLVIESVERLRNPGGAILGIAATLRGELGSLVQLSANWGASGNFSLTLDWQGRRLDLRPFEAATEFEGMEVVDPTPEKPIRTYTPKMVGTVQLDDEDLDHKPGFVAQARALAAAIRGEDTSPAATLEDAYAVLKLAEDLAGERRA